MVIEPDPVCNDSAGVRQAFKPMEMNALFFQRPDHPFQHAVLFRCLRCDELLLPSVALHQGFVAQITVRAGRIE